MSLSRREFFRHAGSAGVGAAVGVATLGLERVEAAATTLRIKEAKVHTSVCPYCSVGCNQFVYSKGDSIIAIDTRTDIRYALVKFCPTRAATFQLSNNPLRPTKALY